MLRVLRFMVSAFNIFYRHLQLGDAAFMCLRVTLETMVPGSLSVCLARSWFNPISHRSPLRDSFSLQLIKNMFLISATTERAFVFC